MKKWLIEGFLPMWAKQTVYRDNRRLAKKLEEMHRENDRLRAYIKGLEKGIQKLKVTASALPTGMASPGGKV